MTRSDKTVIMLITFISALVISCAGVTSSRYNDVALTYSAPNDVVFGPESETILIAESGMHRITERDISNGRIVQTFALDIIPHALAISYDGSVIYIVGTNQFDQASGKLYCLDRQTGDILSHIPLGHTPCDIEMDQDGKTLYICNRFSSNVTVFDCVSNEIVENIPLVREPVDAALTPDNKFLIVVNHLPSTRQIPEYVTDGGYMDISGYKHGTDYTVSSVVMIVDTATRRIIRMIHLPNGSTGIRGVCISPDGRYAYISHILARYHLPTTQLEQGFMNTNAVSVIDMAAQEYCTTILLDDIDRGAANPWGISCSPDGSYLMVTHAGTHELSIIDRHALHDRLDRAHRGMQVTALTDSAGAVPNDLTFLNGIRTRISLTGNGPRALAVNDSLVAVAEFFSDSIGLVPYHTETCPVQQIVLHTQKPDIIRLGEQYFNDATFCFQNWQSCASCHPDARTDGLNWDLLNDGIGNPKNTKSLLYSHRTPPVMITGIRPDAETAVRAGLKYIQFVEHSEAEAQAIDAYLSSLEPIPSPHLADPDIRAYAKHGQRIFMEAGCAACHPRPLFTDLHTYDVGTGAGRERGTAFDTPTLVELWRTEPYLYDGRAHSLDDIFRYYNRNNMHGVTSHLNEREQYELLCYLLTL